MDLKTLAMIKDGRILAKHIHQDPDLDWLIMFGVIVATKDQEIVTLFNVSDTKVLKDFLVEWATLDPIPRATAKGWEVTASEGGQ